MIAETTYGLLGRSPDHVASFVTGMAVNPTVFAVGTRPYAENLVKYYRHMREQDIYAAYAVLPPQAARDPIRSKTCRSRAFRSCARTMTAW